MSNEQLAMSNGKRDKSMSEIFARVDI